MTEGKFDSEASERAKRDLISFGRRLSADRLSIGNAGNLSIRLGDVVAITPSSVPYYEIEPADICFIKLDGTKIEGRGVVSSEWPMHCAIYRSTESAQAIVHTHSPEVVALSVTCSELPAVHYTIVRFGGPVKVVGYSRFGSESLAKGVDAALMGRSAAILQNHGGIAYGNTITQAYERALLLEWLAEVYRLSLQYGAPRILSESELEEVAAEITRRGFGNALPS
jgi:L-fuculose-phosphate aldolase